MSDYLGTQNRHDINLLTQEIRNALARIHALEIKMDQVDGRTAGDGKEINRLWNAVSMHTQALNQLSGANGG